MKNNSCKQGSVGNMNQSSSFHITNKDKKACRAFERIIIHKIDGIVGWNDEVYELYYEMDIIR